MRFLHHLLWVGLMGCLGASCGGVTYEEAKIVEILVEPTGLELRASPDGAAPVQFTATAIDAAQNEYALDVVEWSLSNRTVGTIDEFGTLSLSTENGGVSWVTAKFDGAEGSATVTVIYEDVINDEGVDTSAFERSEQATSGMWLYPEDGVNLPRNTPSIRFQWEDWGAEAYRLDFLSESTEVSVYTTSTSWEAEVDLWSTIVATNAGGQVDVTVSAPLDGVLYTESLEITVNRMDAQGSIFYWSTSAEGIREIPYGEEASDYLTSSQTGQCVACHVVSNSGLMAYTVDGGNGALGVLDMDSDAAVIVPDGTYYANFKTFSPEGQWMLGTFDGTLSLYDAPTGSYVSTLALERYGTHVDWSPDGDRVALVLTDEFSCDWCFSSGDIAVMDYLGDGNFGAPEVIVASSGGVNNYYPAWSPDGEWIAFNRSTGDSYDDEDAEMWVVDSDGGQPIELVAANRTDGLTNSWPRWGPLPDDDVLWLAVASKRDYGTITSGVPQIWVAAFDPEKAENGRDPSWPAFWLPGQDTTQNNHIPVWTD
jgi:hypothetical protein